MRPSELLTYIVTGERGIIPVRREDLDRRLCSIIEDRFSRRHFRTNLEKVSSLPISQETVKDFISACHWVSKLALFDTYTEGERGEFGFIAKRTEEGTLITARGSSKSEATVDDLAVVRAVDLERLTIDVASTGKKASLNASLAHLIFEHRPEVKYIVHAHVSLPEAIVVPRDSSPSTAEDWERMAELVKAGHSIIEQPHHGVCILLESLEDLPAILERNSIYRSNAGHYDKAYHRFLGSTALVDIFSERVSHDEPILDLCSGTGEVSRELLARGFADITLCDASAGMNEVARTKLERLIPAEKIQTATMEELPFHKKFGGIIMRQAVNYIAPDNLVATFQKIGAALQPGGILVFNSFVLDESFSGKVKRSRDEVDNSIVRTCEGNLVRDGRLYHGQKTEIFDAHSGDYTSVYDLNSFWIYSPEQFESALKAAGAQSVMVTRRDNSVYFECRW
jgi:SAM-dependent methyltransferase